MSQQSLPQRTRLTDVAAQAGVSTATVSRVLNGKPGVSPAARQAVVEALDLLGYERPERLRMRSQGLVGLVVPELTNPVFPQFAQVIESMLAENGYTPLLCAQEAGGTTEDQYLDVLLDHNVDGIIFVSGLHADTTANHERYHALRSQGIPIVLVNGHAEDVDAPSVSCDDTAALELAFRHLVQLGHRKIGLAIGPDRFVPTKRKIRGFSDAYARHFGERNVEDHIVTTLFTLEGGQVAAAELLESGHTAIVCGSDMMALGAVRAARQRGLRVPEDVSIVGYDDSPLIAFTDPPLTTVRQPVRSMSRSAVSALVAEVAGETPPRAEMLFLPELIVRGSTSVAPSPSA